MKQNSIVRIEQCENSPAIRIHLLRCHFGAEKVVYHIGNIGGDHQQIGYGHSSQYCIRLGFHIFPASINATVVLNPKKERKKRNKLKAKHRISKWILRGNYFFCFFCFKLFSLFLQLIK